jgi:hypothetical protein
MSCHVVSTEVEGVFGVGTRRATSRRRSAGRRAVQDDVVGGPGKTAARWDDAVVSFLKNFSVE